MATKTSPDTLEVLKTYKLYIGGNFPRTESGRYYTLNAPNGAFLANMCLGSRKDFRDAMVAARKAQHPWASRTAYNRSQILYRIAEVLQGRAAQFVDELKRQGSTQKQAETEVATSIDRLIHYAGWADKYTQIFSSVNPVASSHFNFSVPEPTGVVAAFAPEDTSLLGLVSVIAPAITGGNSIVVVASESKPLCSITFAEVLNASDVPGGVVNILTGNEAELHGHMSTHMDVNAIVYTRSDAGILKAIRENATGNVKRVLAWQDVAWAKEEGQSPYYIQDLTEVKTTWHPIENIGGGAGSKY